MPKIKGHSTSMELLAPAGSFAAFAAALEERADAIYIGAPTLNARALSRDFGYAEIAALVREAHGAGVRLYIAMNSLVKEEELRMAVEGLSLFADMKPDALIIQDFGLFRLARKYFPQLPLHASTLMSVHNTQAVRKLTSLGFRRVVLPRELTLEEIRDIHRKTDAELEVFVHGAMCFSYSGLCLFSSMFGGKSSLRGQCVQPCRRRYAWQRKKGHVRHGRHSEKEGGYLFSMNDLCGIDLLPRLRDAGVSCLKIEGRLKSAEYVRKTVRAYRLLVDNMDGQGPSSEKKLEASRYLDEAMGRRRSTGFFLSPKPPEAVTPYLSGNTGLPVGRVLKRENLPGRMGKRQTILTVELMRDIRVGERLRLHDEGTGKRAAFTLRTLRMGKRLLQKAAGGQKVQMAFPSGELQLGKRPGRGSLFRVDVDSGRGEEQKAKRFLLGRRNKEPVPDVKTIERILKACGVGGTGELSEKSRQSGKYHLPVWIRIRSLRDRQYRLPLTPKRYIVPLDSENVTLLFDGPPKLRRRDQEIVWSLPSIIEESVLDWYAEAVDRLIGEGFRAFQVGHFSQLDFFHDHDSEGNRLELFGYYTCNILNSQALFLYREHQARGGLFSLETDRSNLTQALLNLRTQEASCSDQDRHFAVGMYVYGRPPLFTARLDDSRYRYGKRFVSPRGEVFVLDHDCGITSATAVHPFSLLNMRAELKQAGVDYLVADLSVGNMQRNLREFSALLRGGGKGQAVLAGNLASGLL